MLTRFRLTTTLPRKLEELGVLPADVLRHAGLPAAFFDQEKILATTEELFALYRGLAAASPDPALALKLGTEHRIERYDPIAIAAVSSRSFRDALQRLARFKQLSCPEELRVTERGDEARVEFRYLLAEETEPQMLVDIAFSWVVGIARGEPTASSTRGGSSCVPEAATATCSRRTSAVPRGSAPVTTRSSSPGPTSIARSSPTTRTCWSRWRRSSKPS